MAYTTIYEGVVFVEGACPQAKPVQALSVDLSFKIGAQLKSLRDVKNVLVQKTKACGCNAVIQFTYGQKSRWLAIDDVAFWGKGIAANLSEDDYNEIAQKVENR